MSAGVLLEDAEDVEVPVCVCLAWENLGVHACFGHIFLDEVCGLENTVANILGCTEWWCGWQCDIVVDSIDARVGLEDDSCESWRQGGMEWVSEQCWSTDDGVLFGHVRRTTWIPSLTGSGQVICCILLMRHVLKLMRKWLVYLWLNVPGCGCSQAMEDPVVLVATGQMYDYGTLRKWFAMGNRLCPRTNTRLDDVQVRAMSSSHLHHVSLPELEK